MADNPYSFREIFEAMTLELITSLRRTFMRHKKEELKEGFQWEQWQLVKLRSIQRYRRTNKAIIDSFSPEIKSSIEKILQTSFTRGETNVQRAVGQIIGQAEILFPEKTLPEYLIQPHTKEEIEAFVESKELVKRAEELFQVPREESFFGMNEKKLQALQETVTQDIKKAQHAVLRKMDDVYRQVIYKAEVNMSAGAKTLDQAIDMATKEFLEKGINCVEYKNGRRANIASYAEMALRTASHRATLLGEGKKRSEWGIYTVVVSAHANTCDMCLPWQGKVLIDDVFSDLAKERARSLSQETGDPLLSTAIEERLLHPNCRHTLTTYFPGITQLPEVPDEETARKNYEAEQEQRRIERNIRKFKRLLAGSIDEENREKYQVEVKKWQAKISSTWTKIPS